MSSFILHILFSGLIVFVPSQNGTEMDILLLSAGSCGQHYHASDGTALPAHRPIVFARAGSCTGDCPTRDATIAQFLFPDQSSAAGLDSLESAVSGGGAWQLSGSDLSLRKGSTSDDDLPALSLNTGARGTIDESPAPIPTTSSERGDFTWVANLEDICPDCTFDTSLTSSQPPAIVVARFKLRSGSLFTYSVARIGSDVTPVRFQRLDGSGNVSGYSQAIASWVGADVEVTGSSLDLVEDKFDASAGRTMHLTPDSDGKIEMAVVNIPSRTPPLTTNNPSPGPGKHFEVYYELATNAPAREERLVPFPGAASTVGSYSQVSWQSVHSQTDLWSDLLNGLRLNVGRGPDDRVLCPPSRIGP